jgi:hypothetical protein
MGKVLEDDREARCDRRFNLRQVLSREPASSVDPYPVSQRPDDIRTPGKSQYFLPYRTPGLRAGLIARHVQPEAARAT